MNEKTVKDSRVIVSQVMQPADANPAGNVHGGTIMKLIDNAAGVVAFRHSRCNSVTASVDQINFHYPAFIGDLLTIKASLNLVGKTSMEIGARVESENLLTGKTRHIASAYLTFVSLGDNLKPVAVPGLIFETDKGKKRNQDAQARRKVRLAEKF
ncbi:MAG: acyl-CoA thioesterase [Desulfobacteraceae bacterium]|nr:acyl-CoA thioesterase [Desulfobacteraceae bacterium]MBC2755685.1 acyl-CoA thioesterase [Desulfobacteraceae bacterium]